MKEVIMLTLVSDGGYCKSSTNRLPCVVEVENVKKMPSGKGLLFVNGDSLDNALGYDGVYSGETWPFEPQHFMECQQ